MKFLLAIVTAGVAAGCACSEEFLPVTDNLITDNVPPIPMSLVDDVGRYTDYRSASFVSWHPEKREMLVATRFENSTQIHRLKQPGGARSQVTFFNEPVRWASYQPTHGDYFVFSKDTGGDEFYQNYRFDVDSGRFQIISDGKKRNAGGEWSKDGKQFAYTRVDANEKGAFTEIHVVDPAVPDNSRVVATMEGGGWGVADWSKDGRYVLATEYVSVNESYLWLVDTREFGKRLITPEKGDKTAYRGPVFSEEGDTIFVATDADSEFLRLVMLNPETGKRTVLSDTKWDVGSVALSPDGAVLAYTTNEAGIGVIHLYDVEKKQELRKPKVPVGVIGGLSWHNNNADLAFTLTSAQTPGDVFVYTLTSNIVERWTESETAVNAENFRDPELVTWKSFDGLEITGFLYKPPVRFTGKRPVVISIHGGPEGQFRPTFRGQWNYFMNELGVAMICPNVRGSAGFGKTFVKLDNGFLREDSYKDISALLDWIGEQPGLDSDRVMVMGGSYGGFMTLAVATNYNDRITCSVDVVGISNLRTFLENTQGYRRDLRRVEYGDERDPEMRAFLDRIAPMNKARNITKPIFVIQGANDPRVPKSESDQMVQTLKDIGTDVWYLVATDEGHGFRKKNNADFQFYATVLFAQQHLLN